MAATDPVADVVEVRDVVWGDGQAPMTAGAALRPGEVSLRSGTLRLNARADAMVTIIGPARVRLVSAARVQALAGRPAGFARAAVRALLLCLVIPAVVFDPDQRGLHDRAAETILVRTR